MTTKHTLSDRQRLFAAEYLVDLNATQAAIRAGYSARSAGGISGKLMGMDKIQEAIQEEMSKRLERTYIDQDKLIKEWTSLAYSDITEYMGANGYVLTPDTLHTLRPEIRRCISEITEIINPSTHEVKYKIKLYNKTDYHKMLGQHFGILGKVGLDVNVPSPIQVESHNVVQGFPNDNLTVAEWEEQVKEARIKRREKEQEEE